MGNLIGAVSPATVFSGAMSAGQLLGNLGGNGVQTPQINYPTYTPAAPPNYVAPHLNYTPPDTQTFFDAEQMQMQDYSNEALSQVQQADQALTEAGLSAYQQAFQTGQFREQQALSYTGAGVTLQGSPLLVLEQTRQQGLQEVQAIQSQGLAQARLGYANAFQTINQGNAQVLQQQTQFNSQVTQWGTQAAIQQIQSISQQQQQSAGYVGQNTANIIGAYSQRQPVYQPQVNNSLAQAVAGLGQAFPQKYPNLPAYNPGFYGNGNAPTGGTPASPLAPTPTSYSPDIDPVTGAPINPYYRT